MVSRSQDPLQLLLKPSQNWSRPSRVEPWGSALACIQGLLSGNLVKPVYNRLPWPLKPLKESFNSTASTPITPQLTILYALTRLLLKPTWTMMVHISMHCLRLLSLPFLPLLYFCKSCSSFKLQLRRYILLEAFQDHLFICHPGIYFWFFPAPPDPVYNSLFAT